MSARPAWSLRRRLLLWLAIPLLLLCGFLLLQAFFSARAAADRAYDRLLQASALAIAERVILLDGAVDVDLPYAALQMLASAAQDRVFYRITDARGEFITGYADLPAPQEMTMPDAGGNISTRFYDARYHDEAIRVVLLSKPVITGQVMIEVAQTRTERSLLTRELAVSTAWRLFLLVAVAGVLIWIGVQRNLAPLTALRRQLQQRSAHDLQPLTSNAPSEIAPLIAAINQLMARLDHSIGVMQRFIADAAHQLRTPLAVLQTQAELALRENTSPDLKTTLAQLQDSTRRATRLANQLLDHARASSDISTLNIVPLDLSALAADTTRELVPLALRHAIDLGLEAEPGIQIQGDGVLLRELLKNLIDNAIRYCPAGACITVRVSAAGSAGISLEVEDNGPGIAAAERHRVFDRFYRIPGSYTDGSGLGLAIVKEIVRLHSGKISLGEGTGGGGLKVQILLPA